MRLDVVSTKTRTIVDFSKWSIPWLQVLGKYNYTKAERSVDTHHHTGMIEICYCDKGKQLFVVEGNAYKVHGGEIFIHYPGETHGTGGNPEEKGRLYWFIFKMPPASARKRKQGLEYLLREVMKVRRRHFSVSPKTRLVLESIFHVAKNSSEPTAIRNIRINLLAQTFLLELLEMSTKKETTTDDERLKKVLAFIDKNLVQQLTVATLADVIHLSESRFKTWFKNISGFTPMDYIQRKRVEYAVHQLQLSPTLKLKELAYALNFSSEQYFSTVIKKFTGKSPSSLKKQGAS